MLSRPYGYLTIALILLFIPLLAQGKPPVLSEMRQLVHDFVEQQLEQAPGTKTEITVAGLDPRLKLADCPQPLRAALAGKTKIGRNTTVQLACPDIWSIYVPVRIKTLKQVVVAAANLGPGSVLNNTSLTLAYVDANQFRGEAIKDIQAIAGSKVKRHIQKGKPLLFGHMCLVCKGDTVTIYARKGTLQIKSSGTALKDGTVGEQITVQNTSSGRRIRARVVAVGEVEVNI